MLQAARRVADGQWPYHDFLYSYGPGNALLLAGTFKAFGTSLLWWRILRTLVDAAVAVTVYAMVERDAGPRWALAGWLTAACAMAEPTSANPFPLALLFGLLGVLAAARWTPALAGVFVALAAFWRPDFGIYAAAGVAAALLLRRTGFLRALASFAGLSFLLWLPFAIAAGPGELFESVVSRSLRDGSYWRLPFPISYDGHLGPSPHDLKDLLEFYVPLLLVIGLALVVVLAVMRPRPSPLLGGLIVLGAGYLLYLISRTDAFHATPLLVVLSAAIPLVASRQPRVLALASAAVLALLLVYGASNRVSALVRPPHLEALHLPVADGVKAAPADAAALPRVVALVHRRVPPGKPIYVAPLRSDLVRINNPLLYVLTERPNALREDYALQTSAPAQRHVVSELAAAKPDAIVRWLDPISVQREPNRRGTPTNVHTVDNWIAAHYRLLERDGPYAVLVPR